LARKIQYVGEEKKRKLKGNGSESGSIEIPRPKMNTRIDTQKAA